MSTVSPPQPLREEVVHSQFGVQRTDPYFWLREKEDPRVISHLEAENAYCETLMAAAEPLRKKLFKELRGRIVEDDVSVPYRDNGFYYYERMIKGLNYPVHCRRKGSMEAAEQVILDVNLLAAGKDYFDIGLMQISPDGRWLAYTVDVEGDEDYELRFRDLDAGHDLDYVIAPVSYSGAWAADNRTFFYLREDDSKRPWRMFRHTVGTSTDDDVLVLEEHDSLFYLDVSESQDSLFIFASAESKQTTEVKFLPADQPEAEFLLMLPRQTGVRYYPDHCEGEFYLHTNEDAVNFKLMAMPAANPTRSAWRMVVPHREDVYLKDFLLVRDHLLTFERKRGQDQIRVLNLARHQEHIVQMPDEVYVLDESINMEFDTDEVRFYYSSPITPGTTYSYHLPTRDLQVLKRQVIPSGHNPTDYLTYRRWVPGKDGTLVPLTITHRKDLDPDKTHPTLLYGYGAYGLSSDPTFSIGALSYLERGCIYAMAHVRGGGLLGEPWYDAGKLAHKHNTFEDFIACAEYLIDESLTEPRKLAIEGGSAGGMLVGAVLNQRPELFHGALAAVPFVDVVNTMLDDTLPLTTFEYEEWGDPRIEEDFRRILSYSPYDNVKRQAYPAILITAGINDPRVPYWEAAKWAAALRDHNTGDQPVLLKTNLGAGHTGATGRYDVLHELAFEQSFILHQLGFQQ